MTIANSSSSIAETTDAKTSRAGSPELLSALGITLVGVAIASFVLKIQGTGSINSLNFVTRGIGLYAAFQLIPFFRNHAGIKLQRATRGLAIVWIASVLAQGLGMASALPKSILIGIALADFALRSIGFAQARAITSQLSRSVANALVVGSIGRLAAGAALFTMTATGVSRFTTAAGLVVIADLGATVLSMLFVEMSLPKHFVSKDSVAATIKADVKTASVSDPIAMTLAASAPLSMSGTDDESIDIVLDLRSAEPATQTIVNETVVDLREHAEALVD